MFESFVKCSFFPQRWLLSKNSFCAFLLSPKIKHVHLLVLIWERLQTPTTTTTTTPTTPDANH